MNISIVIPCKNEAKGLSVILPDLVKTYPNAEIIILDDASEDETAEVEMGDFFKKHLNLR